MTYSITYSNLILGTDLIHHIYKNNVFKIWIIIFVHIYLTYIVHCTLYVK